MIGGLLDDPDAPELEVMDRIYPHPINLYEGKIQKEDTFVSTIVNGMYTNVSIKYNRLVHSILPTRSPILASSYARLTATVDFPTPPCQPKNQSK